MQSSAPFCSTMVELALELELLLHPRPGHSSSRTRCTNLLHTPAHTSTPPAAPSASKSCAGTTSRSSLPSLHLFPRSESFLLKIQLTLQSVILYSQIRILTRTALWPSCFAPTQLPDQPKFKSHPRPYSLYFPLVSFCYFANMFYIISLDL